MCSIGFYGTGCNGDCGNCLDINQCYHIDGSCLTGCKAGYQGDTCKTREFTNHLILRDAPTMRFLIHIKLDPGFRVCFVFFAQRFKCPVIVLDTSMIMTCTNMVRWL